MDETQLKADLAAHIRINLRKCVVFSHGDRSSYGIPDLSVTYGGKTTWLELKYADPDFKSHGQQELNMKRLAHVGSAYYVIYETKGKENSVRLVHPDNFATWSSNLPVAGFNHNWIMEKIREIHNDNVRP